MTGLASAGEEIQEQAAKQPHATVGHVTLAPGHSASFSVLLQVRSEKITPMQSMSITSATQFHIDR